MFAPSSFRGVHASFQLCRRPHLWCTDSSTTEDVLRCIPHSLAKPKLWRTSPRTSALPSAAAYVSGYGSGYKSGYQLVSAPYISSHGNERVFPLQETQSPEQMTDGFGFVGNHSRASDTVEDHMTPVAREQPPPRRAVTSVINGIQLGRISRNLSDIPLLDTLVDNGAVARRGLMIQSVGQVLGIDVSITGARSSRSSNGTAAVDMTVRQRDHFIHMIFRSGCLDSNLSSPLWILHRIVQEARLRGGL
jgi:hypothetical protein